MEKYEQMLGIVSEKNRKVSMARFLRVIQATMASRAELDESSHQIPIESSTSSLETPIKAEKKEMDQYTRQASTVSTNSSIPERPTYPTQKQYKHRIYHLQDILVSLGIPKLPQHLYEEFSLKYRNITKSSFDKVKQEIQDRIDHSSKTTTKKMHFRLNSETASSQAIRGSFDVRLNSSLYLCENQIENRSHSHKWVKFTFINELGVKKIVVEEAPGYKTCMISVRNNPQPLYDRSEFYLGDVKVKVEIEIEAVTIQYNQKKRVLDIHRLAEGLITLGRSKENTIVIDEPSVSRFHAEIYQLNDEWFIKNVNDKKIKLFIHTEFSLQKGESSFEYNVENNDSIFINDNAYRVILKNKFTTIDTTDDPEQPYDFIN